MLEINRLCKQYPAASTPLLNNLNLSLQQGESASIRGASGCGKSTLLSLIAGFDTPTSGEILIDGVNLTKQKRADKFRRHHLGVVFQSYNLFTCFNVWDNIAFTARLKGNYCASYQHSIMGQLGIDALASDPVTQLSGGEQQRVAIARALVHRPALVLADEPTGNLDEVNSDSVSRFLYEMCQYTHTTLMVVTHSNEVAERATHAYALRHGTLTLHGAT